MATTPSLEALSTTVQGIEEMLASSPDAQKLWALLKQAQEQKAEAGKEAIAEFHKTGEKSFTSRDGRISSGRRARKDSDGDAVLLRIGDAIARVCPNILAVKKVDFMAVQAELWAKFKAEGPAEDPVVEAARKAIREFDIQLFTEKETEYSQVSDKGGMLKSSMEAVDYIALALRAKNVDLDKAARIEETIARLWEDA